MTLEQIKKLLVASALNQPAGQFSAEDTHEAARNALLEHFGIQGRAMDLRYLDRSDFRLIDEVITEVMPKTIQGILGPWAEVKSYAYGDKVTFSIENGRSERRFKQGVVPGQRAGIYEARRLDKGYIEVPTYTLTVGYSVSLEEILVGTANIAKLVRLIAEGFAEKIYGELINSFGSLKTMAMAKGMHAEIAADTADFSEFDALIAKASAYGPVTLFGFRSAIAELANVAGASAASWTPNRSEQDLMDIRNHGRVLIYKGKPVVELENYLLPDGSWAFEEDDIIILPGGNAPVKVALYGDAHTEEVKIPSGGFEWHVFREAGIAIVTAAGVAVVTTGVEAPETETPVVGD